jgi:uncharacterized membrane protein
METIKIAIITLIVLALIYFIGSAIINFFIDPNWQVIAFLIIGIVIGWFLRIFKEGLKFD